MEEYIIPLGVSAAIPFNGRHLSSVALRAHGDLLLFDCGESTQFQIRAAGIKPGKLKAIFITHLHGDHYFGLLGLLATLSLVGRTEPLTLVGPEGLKAFVDIVPQYDGRTRPFELDVREIRPDFSSGIVFETPSFSVRAARLEHTIFAIGYRVSMADTAGHLDVELARSLGVVDPIQYGQLKKGEAVVGMLGRVESSEVIGPKHRGASFAYVTDTKPCAGGRELAQNVDLLYHESTFLESDRKRAEQTGHSTALGAAEVASAAGAKKLMLSHFSARYSEMSLFEEEARAVFPDATAAVELDRYSLTGPVPTH